MAVRWRGLIGPVLAASLWFLVFDAGWRGVVAVVSAYAVGYADPWPLIGRRL